jgi:hypothetical protein
MDFFEERIKYIVEPELIESLNGKMDTMMEILKEAGLAGPKFVGVTEYLRIYEEKHGVKLSRPTVYARIKRGQLESRKDGGTVLVSVE